jgi:hypothetical protein
MEWGKASNGAEHMAWKLGEMTGSLNRILAFVDKGKDGFENISKYFSSKEWLK